MQRFFLPKPFTRKLNTLSWAKFNIMIATKGRQAFEIHSDPPIVKNVA